MIKFGKCLSIGAISKATNININKLYEVNREKSKVSLTQNEKFLIKEYLMSIAKLID